MIQDSPEPADQFPLYTLGDEPGNSVFWNSQALRDCLQRPVAVVQRLRERSEDPRVQARAARCRTRASAVRRPVNMRTTAEKRKPGIDLKNFYRWKVQAFGDPGIPAYASDQRCALCISACADGKPQIVFIVPQIIMRDFLAAVYDPAHCPDPGTRHSQGNQTRCKSDPFRIEHCADISDDAFFPEKPHACGNNGGGQTKTPGNDRIRPGSKRKNVLKLGQKKPVFFIKHV
jgi:hypothetical protein